MSSTLPPGPFASTRALVIVFPEDSNVDFVGCTGHGSNNSNNIKYYKSGQDSERRQSFHFTGQVLTS